MSSFAEKIETIMRRRGLSQRAFANSLKEDGIAVTQRAISDWLQGATPRPETLTALARHLGVPIDNLAADDKDLPEVYLQQLADDTARVKRAYPGNLAAQIHASDLLEANRQKDRVLFRLRAVFAEMADIMSELDPTDDKLHKMARRLKTEINDEANRRARLGAEEEKARRDHEEQARPRPSPRIVKPA